MMAFPLFGTVPLAPETFAGMPAYLKHEAVLMMRECGMAMPQLCAALRVSPSDLRAVALAPKHFLPGEYDRTNEGAMVGSSRPSEDLTPRRSSGKVVLWMAKQKDGRCVISLKEMEVQIGLRRHGGHQTLTKLCDLGYVANVRKASATRPGIWILTEPGWQAHAEMVADVEEARQ